MAAARVPLEHLQPRTSSPVNSNLSLTTSHPSTDARGHATPGLRPPPSLSSVGSGPTPGLEENSAYEPQLDSKSDVDYTDRSWNTLGRICQAFKAGISPVQLLTEVSRFLFETFLESRSSLSSYITGMFGRPATTMAIGEACQTPHHLLPTPIESSLIVTNTSDISSRGKRDLSPSSSDTFLNTTADDRCSPSPASTSSSQNTHAPLLSSTNSSPPPSTTAAVLHTPQNECISLPDNSTSPPFLQDSVTSPSLAHYPDIIYQITDQLADPQLAARVCRALYDRYIPEIYSCVVVTCSNAEKLLERCFILEKRSDGSTNIVSNQRKTTAISRIKSISFADDESAKLFFKYFKDHQNLPRMDRPSRRLASLQHVHFGAEMVTGIKASREKGSAAVTRRYWSEFTEVVLAEMSQETRPFSICFDLTTSDELWQSYGCIDPVATSRVVDILAFGSLPSHIPTPTIDHCCFHLRFDLGAAIPVIALSIALLDAKQNVGILEVQYHLAIAGRCAPRLFIRSMWLHYCIAKQRLRAVLDDQGHEKVPIRYLIPMRKRLDESLETFWMDEGEGRWSRQNWERFKEAIVMKDKSEGNVCRCGL